MLGMVRHPALATGRPAMTRHHRVHEHHGEREQENECAAPDDGAALTGGEPEMGIISAGRTAVTAPVAADEVPASE